MKGLTISCVFGSMLALWVTACGGDQKQVEDPYLPPDEPKRESAVGAAPECVTANDEPVRCEEDDECCPGFVCGIDPELSSRIKHCIYAGK